MFLQPLPHNLEELKECIVATMSTIDGDMLQAVWDGFDYRTDVCHVTRWAHIEHV